MKAFKGITWPSFKEVLKDLGIIFCTIIGTVIFTILINYLGQSFIKLIW